MVGSSSGVNRPAAATISSREYVVPTRRCAGALRGRQNIGRKRDHNEDSIALPETGERLAIVCDGMGGHASGEVASRLAVELIVDHFTETGKQQTLTWPYKVDRDLRKHINRMITGVMLANLETGSARQREARFKGMGTTCVALDSRPPRS